MKNQTADPKTTPSSNTHVTLTSYSTLTTTAVSSAWGKVSINPVSAISMTITGQDHNFETWLNAMENELFKFGSNLTKFVSANSSSGKPQGENDNIELTDFSVNASQYEIDQSSDDGSNCGPPRQAKSSRNPICISWFVFVFV